MKAGRNNRSLAREETSVTSSEWELFVKNSSHLCFYALALISTDLGEVACLKKKYI